MRRRRSWTGVLTRLGRAEVRAERENRALIRAVRRLHERLNAVIQRLRRQVEEGSDISARSRAAEALEVALRRRRHLQQAEGTLLHLRRYLHVRPGRDATSDSE